jgi:hypothetical protein
MPFSSFPDGMVLEGMLGYMRSSEHGRKGTRFDIKDRRVGTGGSGQIDASDLAKSLV